MSASTRLQQDAPRASGRVIKAFVDATFELEQLDKSMKALRDFFDGGGEDAGVGVRVLGCLLHAHVLAQKLIQVEIVARG